MQLPFRISISTKLLVVISTILLAVTIPLSFKAANLFKEVSTKREEQANLSSANVRAHEINLVLRNMQEKVFILASTLVAAEKNSKAINEAVQASFANDEEMLSLSFYSNDGNISKVLQLFSEEKLSRTGIKGADLLKLEKNSPVPIARILKGEFLVLNRNHDNSNMPIITIGFPLFKNEHNLVTYFAVVDIRQSAFQKVFAEIDARKSYLVSSNGVVLAHPNEAFVLSGKVLKSSGIVEQALKSTLAQGATKYHNIDSQETFFGAFAHTQYGAVVVSEIPESIILEPSMMIRREIYYLTGITLSISLIVIFLFSLTLTNPIVILARIARSIGRGNFNIPVTRFVNSTDEVGSLAQSVASMLEGLRERDKAKDILHKFHGSSVAQDLLSSETMERTGIRKDIAIMFCDIRGFTSMSEQMEPEDVLALLNEYFNTMVKVITKNHGMIDKFIGDAIMAIWGAPKANGTEHRDAVLAALEMRYKLIEFNEQRIANNKAPLRFGIGLHTGLCVSGIVGAEERLEYSVIGDTVNVCSRIESMTKAFGVDILVTAALQEKVSDQFIFEELQAVSIKGKEKPITVFTVKGFYDEDSKPVIIDSPYAKYKIEGT